MRNQIPKLLNKINEKLNQIGKAKEIVLIIDLEVIVIWDDFDTQLKITSITRCVLKNRNLDCNNLKLTMILRGG